MDKSRTKTELYDRHHEANDRRSILNDPVITRPLADNVPITKLSSDCTTLQAINQVAFFTIFPDPVDFSIITNPPAVPTAAGTAGFVYPTCYELIIFPSSPKV